MWKQFIEFFIFESSNLQDGVFSILSDPFILFILILVGFAVGVSIGFSGFGITPILVPSLIVMGTAPHLVIGTVLVVTFLIKGFATAIQSKQHNINWHVVMYLFIPVIPTMVLASWLWIYVIENYGSDILDLMIIFLLGFLLIAAAGFFLKRLITEHKPEIGTPPPPGPHRTWFNIKERGAMLFGGGFVSFIAQITSAGTGPMFLPLIVKIMVSPKKSAATLTIIGVLVAAVGALLHYSIGTVTPSLVLLLIIGAVPGVLFGIRIATLFTARKTIFIFTILTAAAAAFLLINGTVKVLT